MQWNIPLYDDDVLWVVPKSHIRRNTEEENRQLTKDNRVPLASGVQTHLNAGDGDSDSYQYEWARAVRPKVIQGIPRVVRGVLTYTLVAEDVGQYIIAIIAYTDGAGFSEEIHKPLGPILAGPPPPPPPDEGSSRSDPPPPPSSKAACSAWSCS